MNRHMMKIHELLFHLYLLGTGRLCCIRRLGLRIQRQLLQQIRGFFAQQIDELRRHNSVFRSQSFASY